MLIADIKTSNIENKKQNAKTTKKFKDQPRSLCSGEKTPLFKQVFFCNCVNFLLFYFLFPQFVCLLFILFSLFPSLLFSKFQQGQFSPLFLTQDWVWLFAAMVAEKNWQEFRKKIKNECDSRATWDVKQKNSNLYCY